LLSRAGGCCRQQPSRRQRPTDRTHATAQYGVSKQVADLVERDMRNSENPVDSMLEVHAALELGIDTSEAEGAAPNRAALFSFGTFSVGAAIPMLPWLVVQILNRRAPSAGVYVPMV
jgi:hypothetical protein